MNQFRQPGPDSESNGYRPTEFDNLSDEDLAKLINATGRVRVNQQQRPQQKRELDLDDPNVLRQFARKPDGKSGS